MSTSPSLAITHPDLAAQAYGWDASSLTAGSNRKVQWKCDLGHVWDAIVNSRQRGNGCPVCAGRKVLAGFNDLGTRFPELAAEANGWDPSTVLAGTHATLDWKCFKGHCWSASVVNRTKGKGCPVCVGRVILAGFNDLNTTHPNLAAEAHGWDPSTVGYGMGRKLRWECSLGHTWEETPNKRSGRGDACPFCSGQRCWTGFNDLRTSHPQVAAEADGWDPTAITAGSNTKRGWKCVKGHTWTSTPGHRTNDSNPTGCPYCSGNLVWPGFNDLLTTHPEIAAEADGWDPAVISAGSNRRMSWACPDGHKWKSQVNNRKNGSGCPRCAKTGFDRSKDAWLYFLRHYERGLLQIGISNVPQQRISSHSADGWKLIEPPRGPMPGDLAYRLEQEILKALRAEAVVLGPTQFGKFSGFTESWKEHEFPAKSLKELCDLASDAGELL